MAKPIRHPGERPVHAQQNKITKEVNEEIASPPTRRYRARLFQGYVVFAAIGFTALAFFVRVTPRPDVDIALIRVLQSFNPFWFDALMRAVSQLGFDWKAMAAISLITLFLFFTGLRWEAVVGVAASTGVWMLDNIVKTLVARPRPTPDLVQIITHLDGPSFTSGHVTSFTAFYGYLWFLSYTLLKPSWKRTALLSVLGSLILLVGLSRVYSGEHWPTDVLGSYLLGSLWLAVIIRIYRWGKERFFKRQPVAAEE